MAGKLRTIKVAFADSLMEKINEFARACDMLGPHDGAVKTAVITTRSRRKIENYTKVVERAFSEADPGSKVYSVWEE